MIPLYTDKVRCRDCEHVFVPTLEDVAQKDGSVKRRFECPECCREYPVARITERGLRLTHELQSLEVGPETEEKVNHLREEIKREVTRWVE